jgi:hypothetical protein
MKEFLQACDDHIFVVIILLLAIGWIIDRLGDAVKKRRNTKP